MHSDAVDRQSAHRLKSVANVSASGSRNVTQRPAPAHRNLDVGADPLTGDGDRGPRQSPPGQLPRSAAVSVDVGRRQRRCDDDALNSALAYLQSARVA